MSFISDAILRGATGAFVTNAGVGKIGMPAEYSAGVQQAEGKEQPEGERGAQDDPVLPGGPRRLEGAGAAAGLRFDGVPGPVVLGALVAPGLRGGRVAEVVVHVLGG